jgi:hypothetical protein
VADNTLFQASLDPAQPRIADLEVPHSGENAKVQIIQLGIVTGTEGARTLQFVPGDSVFTQSVAIGASVPATGIDLFGLRNWGLFVPSTFDGTQIFFQTSDTLGGTYSDVYDILNARVQLTVTAGRYYDIPGELMAVRFVKICTVTNQATTTTVFTVIGK